MNPIALRIAVVGAGPVGLALALQAARALPQAQVCVFDARPPERDIAADPRTIALSLGSVLLLRRLMTMPPAQPIFEVHVSQQTSSFGRPAVRISAEEEGVTQLGAVLSYGALVAPLQQAWQAAVAAEPARLRLCLGAPVAALNPGPLGVEVDAGVAETFDLAVVAEGGLFGEQLRKPLRRDYGQTAWVGSVTLEGAAPGLAIERFTAHGPVALLPLAPGRAALVWCVASAD
ncbi:MAG: 2-octaprenyl-6-methoxyphenyl hydroxylase, partial [Burkholderiales bacterium]|nr:2-octaprenyl-6-methoxyphenyl hydroxylase [Burkholderiales bacterium]